MDRQRIDKWLWHARLVRTRTDAAGLVAAGRVRLNGRRTRAPGQPVRRGDVLTVALDRAVRVMQVADFCDRRGDAAQARALYRGVAGDSAAASAPAEAAQAADR